MIYFMETIVNLSFFKWMGLLFVLKILYTNLSAFYEGFMLYIWPYLGGERDFTKDYGKWAVITGGSDGIGKFMAHELAANGMNVFILSNAEKDLMLVSQEIKVKYGVSCKWHCVDFRDFSCYGSIKTQLNELDDIGILVNNVGVMNEDFKTLLGMSDALVKDIICVNAMSTAMMTRIVAVKMIEKGKGLIVNMGSSSTAYSLPCYSIYSGSKMFVHKFTECFAQEVQHHGVQVTCIEPSFVRSGLLTRDTVARAMVKYPSIIIPTPQTLAKSVVRSLNVKVPTFFTGYWVHAVQHYIVFLLLNIPVKSFSRKLLALKT